MGFLNLPADALSVPRADKLAWHEAGTIQFCTCKAGQMARQGLNRQLGWDAEWGARMTAEQYAAQERRLSRIFDAAEVPARFAALEFRTFAQVADEGKREAVRVVKEYQANGQINTPAGPRFGILLHGPTDQGKTGALSPLFLRFVKQGSSGLWVQYNDLLAALRDFESGHVEERITAAKQVEYLLIDDFGDPAASRAATDYARDVLFRIVDYRNNYQKPTFITSNLHPDQMAGQFHERMVKRLHELCAIVRVDGAPMRELLKRPRGWAQFDEAA
jgi:DNA replication protein DnaC